MNRKHKRPSLVAEEPMDENRWGMINDLEVEQNWQDAYTTVTLSHGCGNRQDFKVWYLRGPNRHVILRVQCPVCLERMIVKIFRDRGSSDTAMQCFQRESSNLVKFKTDNAATNQLRVPPYLAVRTEPRPLIVTAYEALPDLLCIIKMAITGGDNSELMNAMAILGRGLAAWHNVNLVSPSDGTYNSVEELPRMICQFRASGVSEDILLHLNDLWIQGREIIMSIAGPCTVVHDDLSPLNLLWSESSEQFIFLDFESAHMDHPIVDVGTVCAEIKYAFTVHAWNSYLAEPLIGCFLRNYFAAQAYLDIPYEVFTDLQRFFMGRRLLNIGAGSGYEVIREWSIREAIGTLSGDRVRPASRRLAQNVKGVLFDFYNTLIKIRTEEDIKCFDEATNTVNLWMNSRCKGFKLSPESVRDAYYEEVALWEEQCRDRAIEIRQEQVWITVLSLLLADSGIASNPAELATLCKQVNYVFRKASIRERSVEPDTVQTLETLRKSGIRLGVVSNAQAADIGPEIFAAGILPFLDVFITSEDIGLAKPEPEIFRIAMKRLNMDSGAVLFVGDDMYTDIHGAKEAGMRTCLKLSAFPSKGFLNTNPDFVIRSLRELVEIVSKT